mgnify:CR=1 FL=1
MSFESAARTRLFALITRSPMPIAAAAEGFIEAISGRSSGYIDPGLLVGDVPAQTSLVEVHLRIRSRAEERPDGSALGETVRRGAGEVHVRAERVSEQGDLGRVDESMPGAVRFQKVQGACSRVVHVTRDRLALGHGVEVRRGHRHGSTEPRSKRGVVLARDLSLIHI